MNTEEIFKPNSSVYCVGIKGTGVCALAELMYNTGLKVSGSDTSEVFYTDKILKELNIPFYENFDASRIGPEVDIVIHSPAYSAESNPELARALELNIPVLGYPQALGAWSEKFDSTGVCGVHGKTTTAAMCGVTAKAAFLPAQILTGSAAFDFGGRSTLDLGKKYFIAETCEYREHFLSFHPSRIILTSVEIDHQDYFKTYESIRGAFVRYCSLLPEGGQLIYCADDAGASEVAGIVEKEKPEVKLIPYGFSAAGDFKIVSFRVENERSVFSLAGFPVEFKLRIPGRHETLNAAAAIALTASLAKQESSENVFEKEKIQSVKNALDNFRSTKRRSEIIGEAGGITFMDDYAHHPTAVRTTLAGLKSFYPKRRLVVSFMSHTYTRTSALLEEFASAFFDADILFLHRIYASAREDYKGGVNGRTLYEKALAIRGGETRYADEPGDAFSPLCEILRKGDIFITLGAGNNWPLAEKLFAHYREAGNG
ncbi:MAG: UDP-N-acetylmuramate--L-alanine ligase [Treponema sp.]|nr:UDP-N-acetylmuramate--L-alanine ligase [Treponema sp.]MCL2271423.1 UDP-N-acetylmuramate--L-alanine ligase [Treponema sp.]